MRSYKEGHLESFSDGSGGSSDASHVLLKTCDLALHTNGPILHLKISAVPICMTVKQLEFPIMV